MYDIINYIITTMQTWTATISETTTSQKSSMREQLETGC